MSLVCLVHLSGYHRRRFTEYHLALLSLIAIGNVVDDAIVVLENVTTHIERGSEPKQAAIHATNEVAISVIASTLTMIAVFFPLTMVSGMSGVLFRQLGWMMCVIMTVSTVSALSFYPDDVCAASAFAEKQSKMFPYALYADSACAGRSWRVVSEPVELGCAPSSDGYGRLCRILCGKSVLCQIHRYRVLPGSRQ